VVSALGVLIVVPSYAGAAGSAGHVHLNCAESSLCTEVADYRSVFGPNYYVGHDEPSTLFYSNQPGSGNRMRYTLTLPSDPSPSNPLTPGKSYNFQLHGAFWFGMAMCDTQSYPNQLSTCAPDSDKNIVDPKVSPKHPGTAFTELQFYPPGWVKWPAFQVAVGSGSCDPTKWCVALNIDSLSEDPVAGTAQNPTRAAKTGLEYVNFAFVTRNGEATGPANPLDSTTKGTWTPDPGRDLFMNSGDRLAVTMHDTSGGLRVQIDDLTTAQSGSMTASPGNGFAQIKYAPTGDDCKAIPYAFHPMYSTSSPQTKGHMGGAHLQRWLLGRNRSLAVLQRCGSARDPVRRNRRRRADQLPGHEHRGRRRAGRRRGQLLLPRVRVLARSSAGLHGHEYWLRRGVISPGLA
jgi:hypothetical protein